jgi:hypothetical protein
LIEEYYVADDGTTTLADFLVHRIMLVHLPHHVLHFNQQVPGQKDGTFYETSCQKNLQFSNYIKGTVAHIKEPIYAPDS